MLKVIFRATALALFAAFVVLASPTTEKAAEPIEVLKPQAAELSPTQVVVTIKAEEDNRGQILAKFFLSQGSPLAPHAEEFVAIADKYEIDWRFLPAVAGVESTYAQRLLPGSHNPYGWGAGRIYFKDYPTATETVARELRTRWGRDGRSITPANVGPTYAGNPQWAAKVTKYMTQIGRFH